MFPSYTVNYTSKIFDRLEYLKELYPNEYIYLKQNKETDRYILEKLKNIAIMEGKLKPLAQGEEWGYIDEEQGLVWSGE